MISGWMGKRLTGRFELFKAQGDHVLDVLDRLFVGRALRVARLQCGTLGDIPAGFILFHDDLGREFETA